jgi:HEAT repeat protein
VVAIRASASKEIDALVADLAGASSVTREAAVARLTVIGARAVARLSDFTQSDASPAARAAALRALEGIPDARSLDAALGRLDDADAGVAAAAIAVVRRFLRGERSAEAVDRLTAMALDRRRPDPLRVGAVRALKDLDAPTIAPLLESLASDASAAVRDESRRNEPRTPEPRDPAAALAGAAESGLPDDAAALKGMLVRGGGEAPLEVLLRIVERTRDREAVEPPAGRGAWMTARAVAHAALARRGSRLALYDLRESLERSRDPLPVDALTALSLIGDTSCLEPIAAAHARTRDAWWRDHLAEVFAAIVERERLTRRHAVLKRIAKRWPALAG